MFSPVSLRPPALMRAAVAAIVGADIAPTCVAAKLLVIIEFLTFGFFFSATRFL